MKDLRIQWERAQERRQDLEAYIRRLRTDGLDNEQVRLAREELAAITELCGELAACLPKKSSGGA